MAAVVPALAAVAVLCGGAGVLLVRRRVAVVSVAGQSMEPTVRAGDRVLVRRAGLRAVRAGQIIVVEAPSTTDGGWAGPPPRRDLGRYWMIKRAAAVPGDALPPGMPATLAGDAQVPAGQLVVLGDNAATSIDSRHLGYIPGDRLLGVVIGSLPRRVAAQEASPRRDTQGR